MHFLIQGHYNTTPARDNIVQDDPWNLELIDTTAELVVRSLVALRDLNMMSVDVLQSMPIRPSEFPEDNIFYPIYSSVRNIIKEETILPTYKGDFVSASNAMLSRSSDLRELLSDQVLADLYENSSDFTWLSDEISENRTPDLRKYLMEEIGIEEITPEKFAGKINHEVFGKSF